MRILVITQYYYPEQFRINDVCKKLVEKGHKVTVLTGLPNYPDGNIYPGYRKIKKQIIEGVEINRIKIFPRKKNRISLLFNYISFAFFATIKIKFMTNDYDIIYSYQVSPVTAIYPAKIAKKRFKIPLIVYCLDIWPEAISEHFSRKGFIYKMTRRISIKLYSSANSIIVSSKSFIDYLEGNLRINSSKIYLLPQHAEDYYLYSEIIYNNDSIVDFVYIGSINKNQDFYSAFTAFAQINNNYNFRVHIIGSGSSLNDLKKLAMSLGLENKITFYGYKNQEKLTDYINMADVLMLFLKNDRIGTTVPAKLQSYMAMGKFILATAIGETKEIIEEANCGIVVEPGNINLLIQIIREILDEKIELKQYGTDGRKYFIDNFTIDRHIINLQQIIEKLII